MTDYLLRETLKMVEMCLFKDFGEIISFYNFQKPGRAISVNLLENDSKTRGFICPFSIKHRVRLWAKVCYILNKALNKLDSRERLVFSFWYLGERTKRPHYTEIAKEIGTSNNHVHKISRRAKEVVEKEFIKNALLLPPKKVSNKPG